MIRTQVYLTPELYNQLILAAKFQQKPVAQVLRVALQKGMREFPSPKNNLIKLAGLKIKGGPKNISRNLDKYLYS